MVTCSDCASSPDLHTQIAPNSSRTIEHIKANIMTVPINYDTTLQVVIKMPPEPSALRVERYTNTPVNSRLCHLYIQVTTSFSED